MKSPVFYKILSGVLAAVILAGGVLAAVLIHHAQLEAEHFRKDKEQSASDLANATLKLQRNEEFLAKLQNDPEFLDRLARVRLGYAKSDETIVRFDPDAVTSAPPTTDETAIHDSATATDTKAVSPAPKPKKPANSVNTAHP